MTCWRITGSAVSIAGGTHYPFTYMWNLADALVSTTYPSGRVVTNGYDAVNRISTVSGTLEGNKKTYLSSLSYAPQGGPLAHTFGNSLTRTYDYNNRLQLRELVDRLPSVTNPILDLQYYYGSSTTDLYASSAQNNGNPRQIKIGAQEQGGGASYGFTQTYGFDTLNRVTSMSDNGGAAENFGYDRYGNVWLSATPTGVAVLMTATGTRRF